MIVNIFSNGTNIHITDTGNAYNVSIPDQKSFSDMSVRKSELNKVQFQQEENRMFIIKDKKNKTITYDEGDAYAYKKVVYGCYSSEADATFIMADIIEKKTNRCISTEVTGFYFGEPDFEYTEKYQNTRKAEF